MNKNSNNKAFLYAFLFSISIYFLLLLYISVSSEPLNEVVLVLIPILIIEYSKAIYEALADKKDVNTYERDKKTLGILSPLMASIVILAYIIITVINPEDPTADVVLFFTAITILISISLFSKHVISKIDDNEKQEVDEEQNNIKSQLEDLELNLNDKNNKIQIPSLTERNKNNEEKSQLILLTGLVLMILSIIMKLFNRNKI